MFSKRRRGRHSEKLVLFATAVAVLLPWPCDVIAGDDQQTGRMPAQVRPRSDAAVIRDPIRVAMERLSEHELKQFYLQCCREVAERRLDTGETMACSIAYDVLLNNHFAGDFHSLLAWSKAQPLESSSRAVSRPSM